MSMLNKLLRMVGFGAVLFIALSVHADNQAGNCLKNSGFEYKSISDGSYGNLPLYWTRSYYSAYSTFDVSDECKKHGEQALVVTDTSSTYAAGVLSDPVPVSPGYVYTASVWAYRSASAASGSLFLRFYDSTNGLCGSYAANVGSVGAWSLGQLTKAAPTNAATVRILLYSGSSSVGTIYFDSVGLVLADEEVWDGGFDLAVTNALPENWVVYSTHTGASQSVYSDGGNNVIRLVDTSATLSCGAYYKVPVSPGTPYRLSANVAAVSCSANIYLKFYTASGTLLETYSASTTSSSYTPLEVTRIAPAGAAYAMVLLYTPTISVGQGFFDNVSLRENYTTRYAAPVAQGDGSGTNDINAALYTSSTFWTGVKALLTNSPVKVVLKEGDYSTYWTLSSTGNETNHLLITGETPYAVNYSDATNSVENYYIYVTGCKNITLRHLHFTADEDPLRLGLKDNTVHDYRGVLCLNGSYNILLEGLSFTDLLMMEASACSVWGPVSHDITWEKCSFVKTGWDLYDHCIYNTSLASNLNVEACYFQDCNGVYVRYRSGSKGEVKDNTFISTGTQPTGDIYGRPHWSFVQVCAMNNGSSDEILSDSLVVSGNSFTFETTVATNGFLAPFWIYAQGPAPTNHPGYHLVPPATGAYIENTTNNISSRNAYIAEYFGIDLVSNYLIADNTYSGCWPVLFMMTSEPDPRYTYWTNLPSPTPEANCDLDKLLGLD